MAQLLKAEDFISKITKELREKLKSYLPSKVVSISSSMHYSSSVYIKQQKKIAASLGVEFEEITCSGGEEEFIKIIKRQNEDEHIKGIILQKPLPKNVRYSLVVDFINPDKDIEGVTSVNTGRLCKGIGKIVPPTARASFYMVQSIGVPLYGKKVVIVGHSNIVGKPLLHLFLNEMATVSICHVATFNRGDLKHFVEEADVLCVAVGKPHLIKGEWIKKGAVVIDIGINKVGGKVVGDVEFDVALQKASFITPVPGGVGPLTCVFLFDNLWTLLKG